MDSQHAIVGCWKGAFNEDGLQQWVENLRSQLSSDRIELGLIFATPHFFDQAHALLEVLQIHGHILNLVGCSSTSLIANGEEFEDGTPKVVLGLYHLPEAAITAHHFDQTQVESGSPESWHRHTGLKPDQLNGWLVFADPFHIDSDSWLQQWNQAYPGKPIIGGLASGNLQAQRTQVYLNNQVYESGGVAVSFGGGITLETVIAQGCTPIGETWTITKVDNNIIYEIGNRPAYEVLIESVQTLPAEQQKEVRGNLFIGLVMDEYQEDFHQGDFLVRNLIGVEPASGALAVGALPRLGQTVQFQRRDAAAAAEDLSTLLQRKLRQIDRQSVLGACLCSCNGRGYRLFGKKHHDAALVQSVLGPFGLAGFFCNGEIGPVGSRSFLHGYTASLALFLRQAARQN